jgi:hypothetical protein
MDPDLRAYLQREDVREVANKIMADGAADSMLTPTVNIGTIRGGVKVVGSRDTRRIADSHAADASWIAASVIKHASWIAPCLAFDETSKGICGLS